METAFKAVSLDFKEGLELGQLFLGFLLHLSEGVFELNSLFLNLSLKFGVPQLGTVFSLFKHPGFLCFKKADLIEGLGLDFFGS